MSSSKVLLRGLLVETKDGEWGKDAPFDSSVEMHVIRGTDFDTARGGAFDGVPVRQIAGKAAAKKSLQPGDILIETAGGSKGRPTGRTVFLRSKLFEKATLPVTCASFARFMRVDSNLAEPEFVYWYLQFLYSNGTIENHQVQHTGIARFQFTKFADSTYIELPERSAQREIVGFLGALDGRITLLGESNATLEAIAQALFKSWFVDFDPVRVKQHGRAPEGMDEATAELFPNGFEESALGLVPTSWQVGRIEDLMELAYGKALKSTERVDGPVPVYGAGGVTGYHNEPLINGPSVIVGRKGTVGSLYWEDRPFFPIDTVFYVKAQKPLTYCYNLLQTLGLTDMNTDAAVPGLNRNNVYRLQVAIPPDKVLVRFDNIVSNLRERIFANTEQAQTLAILRDNLLPRLISGQLRLPEAEALVA